MMKGVSGKRGAWPTLSSPAAMAPLDTGTKTKWPVNDWLIIAMEYKQSFVVSTSHTFFTPKLLPP